MRIPKMSHRTQLLLSTMLGALGMALLMALHVSAKSPEPVKNPLHKLVCAFSAQKPSNVKTLKPFGCFQPTVRPLSRGVTFPVALAASCPRWGCAKHDGRDCSRKHAFVRGWPSQPLESDPHDKQLIQIKGTELPAPENSVMAKSRINYRLLRSKYKGRKLVICKILVHDAKLAAQKKTYALRALRGFSRTKGSFTYLSSDGISGVLVYAMLK